MTTTKGIEMAKLTYWFSERFDDNTCYSIVAKTKRQAQQMRDDRLKAGPCDLGPVVKRTIIYKDAFDLLELLTSEDGGRGYENA